MVKGNQMNYFKLALKGFCMGVADVIPGVSGGTIAFLLGIYEELIQSIKSFDFNFISLIVRLRFKEAFSKVQWKFLAVLFSGIVCAILSLAKLMSWLLVNKPVLINGFFFGLILATVPLIGKIMKSWSIGKCVAVIVSSIVMFWIVSLVPAQTPNTPLMIFLSGALAISAMILPGISGSFILVILGKYHFILEAINQRDLISIGIFIAGIVVGIVSFVRLLSWLFQKYHDITVSILTGIVIGSLNKIWPWKETISFIKSSHGKIIPTQQHNYIPQVFDGEVVLSCVLMASGFLIAFLLNGAGNSSSDRRGINV